MSLELAIQNNTSAIHALIVTLGGMPAGIKPVQLSAAPVEEKHVAKKSPQAKPAPDAVAQSTPSETGDAAAKITYDMISKPFLELVNKKGRDVAVGLLNDLGVPAGKKLSHLTEEDYPRALEAIQKALA